MDAADVRDSDLRRVGSKAGLVLAWSSRTALLPTSLPRGKRLGDRSAPKDVMTRDWIRSRM